MVLKTICGSEVSPTNYYAVCSDWEYKLLKAGDGSNVEIPCPKCKHETLISVKKLQVAVVKEPDA